MPDPVGQVDTTPDLGQGGVGPGDGQVAAEPFFKYGDQSFDKPESLEKFIRENEFRRADYTKKTQEHAEKVKSWENERASFYQQVNDFGEKRKGWEKYEQLDKRMKSDPAFARAVMKAVQESSQGGVQGEDLKEMLKNYLEETGIPKKLSDFEAAEKRRMAEAERDEQLGELAKKYPDLNREQVLALWDEIMAPDKKMGDFLELLHYASRGKNVDPAVIQKKTLEGLEKKKTAGIPTSGGASYSGDGKPKAKNMRELAEKLKAGAGD